jgi:hypothetical protein
MWHRLAVRVAAPEPTVSAGRQKSSSQRAGASTGSEGAFAGRSLGGSCGFSRGILDWLDPVNLLWLPDVHLSQYPFATSSSNAIATSSDRLLAPVSVTCTP